MPINQFNRSNVQRYESFLDLLKNHNSDKCLLWPFGTNEHGYGILRFNGRKERAHRLAFFVANGRWPTPEGRHTCDTPACFNPRHVVEGTHKQNGDDMAGRNRSAQGERHGNAVLTEDAVRQIRSGFYNESQRMTAQRFGVGQSVISRIRANKSWPHI